VFFMFNRHLTDELRFWLASWPEGPGVPCRCVLAVPASGFKRDTLTGPRFK
jgi:hypothetical protein